MKMNMSSELIISPELFYKTFKNQLAFNKETNSWLHFSNCQWECPINKKCILQYINTYYDHPHSKTLLELNSFIYSEKKMEMKINSKLLFQKMEEDFSKL